MVDGVKFLIILVVVIDYCCHGIIRDQDAGYAAEVLIHICT